MTATKTTLKTKLAAILAAIMIAFGMAFVVDAAWAGEVPEGSVCSVTADGELISDTDCDENGYFKKVEAAFEALKNIPGKEGMIEVYENYTNSPYLKKALEIPQEKTVTLNIGSGVTLSLGCSTKYTKFAISNNGTLNIDGEGTFKATINNNNVLNIDNSTFTKKTTNNGVLTINGGVFKGQIENCDTATINDGTFSGKIYNYKTLTINNGTFTGSPGMSLPLATSCISNSGDLEITNATIGTGPKHPDYGICSEDGGTVNLSNTTIHGERYAIYAKNSTINIESRTSIKTNTNGIRAMAGTTVNIGSESSIEAPNGNGVELYTIGDSEEDTPALSTLNMTGGTITARDLGIAGNGNDGESTDSVINISGGEIHSDNTGVFLPMICTFKMTGGKITGATGIEAKLGELAIESGEITGTGTDNSGKVQVKSGTDPDGSAVTLVPYTYPPTGSSNLRLTVDNGKITSEQGSAISVYNSKIKSDGSAVVELKGGTYEGKSASIKYYEADSELEYELGERKGIAIIPEGNPKDIDGSQDVVFEATDGTYSSNVTDYCKSGYTAISTDSGKTYSIVSDDEADSSVVGNNGIAVAKIGSKYYGSVGAAIEALRQSKA
ncbi:hypothetical protein GMI69_02305 [Eggerthellaceae bacterium zg-887]|uniref:hypothetical protein n=1 Tax=Xiamenia xianingshaonis TaxID=2682776 RepID=UPI00140752C9|nr:hypothetical protein [Xiamenia xianingshaonis]NHM15505.1 hypothetical protein [Xiamenia xianingshaonis]